MRTSDAQALPSDSRGAAATVCGLVLAAGAGRRFGSAKQMSLLNGRPLVEHALGAMARAAVARFVVVLGASADEVLSQAELQGAQPVLCEDWEEGQAASLRAGVEALRGAEAVIVILGDQPLITPAAIDRVAASRESEADGVRATYGGRPGHPVLLERSLLERIPGLRGDVGARELLAGAELVTVPCDDVAEPTDVDTPSRLAELNERLQSREPDGGGVV